MSEHTLTNNVIKQGSPRKDARTTETTHGIVGRVRHVQKTAGRKVDLSSSYLEDGSKAGLNRTLRLLLCNPRIIAHVLLTYGGVKICAQSSHIIPLRIVRHKSTPARGWRDNAPPCARVWLTIVEVLQHQYASARRKDGGHLTSDVSCRNYL